MCPSCLRYPRGLCPDCQRDYEDQQQRLADEWIAQQAVEEYDRKAMEAVQDPTPPEAFDEIPF